jgi:carboxymethylenebutenolidase
MIEFQAGDKPATGYLARPERGQGPGVLVLHAWWGLNDFFKELCDRLAAAGFVALAPDMYNNGVTAGSIAEAEQLLSSSDFEEIKRVVVGAVDYLREQSIVQGEAIGVIGFSMGAAWAQLLSAVFKPTDIGATVIFYGNEPGLEGDDFAKTQAAFLGHFAESDEYEPLEPVRQTEAEIGKAGREVAFHIYPGTSHWFFESNQPDAYNKEAAQLAWERTVTFLHTHLS